MKGYYFRYWGRLSGRTRAWTLLWLSPLFVAALLALLPFLVDDEALLLPTALTWTAVALVSATFADVMRRRTRRALRVAQKSFAPHDPECELAKFNHSVALAIETVHALFLVVGFAALFLPEGSTTRRIISRDGILIGQYVLMLIILRTYYVDRQLRKMLEDE